MSTKTSTNAREFSYEAYQSRQYEQLSPEVLNQRAGEIRKAGKFRYTQGAWADLPYKGYALLSTVKHAQDNVLKEQLTGLQQQLKTAVTAPGKMYLLPHESFHQTVANTLSGDRFYQHIESYGLETEYPSYIEQALYTMPDNAAQPPVMQLIGLSIFSSSIGILGVFEDPEDFETIQEFRDCIYLNPALSNLGIVRTRPFIGHITLAYIEDGLTDKERAQLATVCADVNEKMKNNPLHFTMKQVALMQYDGLSYFHYRNEYPVYRFT